MRNHKATSQVVRTLYFNKLVCKLLIISAYILKKNLAMSLYLPKTSIQINTSQLRLTQKQTVGTQNMNSQEALGTSSPLVVGMCHNIAELLWQKDTTFLGVCESLSFDLALQGSALKILVKRPFKDFPVSQIVFQCERKCALCLDWRLARWQTKLPLFYNVASDGDVQHPEMNSRPPARVNLFLFRYLRVLRDWINE